MKAGQNVPNANQVNVVKPVIWIAKQVVKIAYAILIQVSVHVAAVKMDFILIAGIGSVIHVKVPDAAAAAILIRVTRVQHINIGVQNVSTIVITVHQGATKPSVVQDFVRVDITDSMMITKGDIFVRAVQSAAHLVHPLRYVIHAKQGLLTEIYIISANAKTTFAQPEVVVIVCNVRLLVGT